MRIDRKLNLIVPIDVGNGQTIYVHSMPISRDVFQKYHLVIAKAFASMYQQGLGAIAGPRIAAMLIRDAAASIGEDMTVDVERGLMAEMRRLSNILALGKGGWEAVPLQEAVDRGTIEEDDADEVENAIAYFTLASSMHRKADLKEHFAGAWSLWGAHVTSSTIMEYAASLPTSTAPASSGATTAGLSVPS
jgi:hypothetical protein